MPELHVYDFDGTLFRSPEKPDWWNGKFWWFDPQSLDEPCVPEKPGGGWWIGSTVSQARKSIADPDVWTILMTGRSDKRFRWRVPELLKSAGLSFDEVHLAPNKNEAEYFKVSIVKKVLGRYPFIEKVQFWDDNTKNLGQFQSAVEGLGLEVEIHPVKVPAHKVLCTPEQMESVQRVASTYDPTSWYYDYEPGTDLQTVIDRWQEGSPRQKMYDRSMPVMLSMRELWPLREYTWTREKARGGFAKVKGNLVWLEGPLKWDALLEDLRLNGWDQNDPLRVEIGGKGGVKVGEGNHRLALARQLGISKVPVWFDYASGKVRKQKPVEDRKPIEVSPKAIERVVVNPPRKLSPEGEAQVAELLGLLGLKAAAKRVASAHMKLGLRIEQRRGEWPTAFWRKIVIDLCKKVGANPKPIKIKFMANPMHDSAHSGIAVARGNVISVTKSITGGESSLQDLMETMAHELRHVTQHQKGWSNYTRNEEGEAGQVWKDGKWYSWGLPWEKRPWEQDAVAYERHGAALFNRMKAKGELPLSQRQQFRQQQPFAGPTLGDMDVLTNEEYDEERRLMKQDKAAWKEKWRERFKTGWRGLKIGPEHGQVDG